MAAYLSDSAAAGGGGVVVAFASSRLTTLNWISESSSSIATGGGGEAFSFSSPDADTAADSALAGGDGEETDSFCFLPWKRN